MPARRGPIGATAQTTYDEQGRSVEVFDSTQPNPPVEIVTEDYSKNVVGPQAFSNASVTTTESQLSVAHKPFGYLLVFTRNNGTTNSDFILVGEQGAEVVDLGVGDSFLFTDMIPANLFVKSNSGTQVVYAIGWGKPSWE